MDYSQFRSSSGQSAAVGVNHRALITRALTKYPVDYALFRELLQNSADAKSHCAVIQMKTPQADVTGSNIHDVPISHLCFTNDGLDFSVEDWARLREIASGNPNETKIGAFGVGFYSVFELTDEPLVHSGNQVMSFKYHGVQLHYYFTEKAPTYQKGTLIDLPYREEQRLPDLVKFIGFLVQSFMLVNLTEIRFELIHGKKTTRLLHLTKKVESPQVLPRPPAFHSKSPSRTLTMARLERRKVTVGIEYLNATQMPSPSLSKGLFSFGVQLVTSLMTTSADPDEYTTVECDLMKADAFVEVNVSSGFRKKMVETLLKPPPKQAVMSLISFSSVQQLPKKSQLTSYIFPNDYNDAKIFIGFATKQSTGFKSHLALNQVIPTMERTAVDMSNQFVKDWNSEMLYMGGVMARCVYEYELSQFQVTGEKDMTDALFVCSRFRFGKSAPDEVIGLHVREGFWKCSQQTLVPSTQGILSSTKVRLAGDAADILRKTPVVTEKELTEDLERLKYVQTVTLSEICDDISSSALTKSEYVTVVKWLAKKWPRIDQTNRSKFLTATTVRVSDTESYNLGSLVWYHDRTLHSEEEIAATLPPNCLPSELANSVGMRELETLGLSSLRLPDWVESRIKALASAPTNSQVVIAKVMLHITNRTWPRLSKSQRHEILRLINSVKCIPTQQGLKFPSEAYAQEIKLFPNLPVISPDVDVTRAWLLDIGVRQSMNMEFVLHALESHELKWTNEDLVQYLCENESMLKGADWQILRNGAFFTQRGTKGVYSRADQLYAPQPVLIRLGLPTLNFAGWSDNSTQSRLLFKIGLRQFPDTQTLFKAKDKEAALNYFVTHFDQARYSPKDISDFEIIPTLTSGVYAKPSSCFRDADLLCFGEQVISHKWEAFSNRLGVAQRPSTQILLHKVLKSPEKYVSASNQANEVFAYFSKYIGEITASDVQLCRSVAFISVFDDKGTLKFFEKPRNLFFLRSDKDSEDDILRPLLQTIHPSQGAVPFLRLAGVSDKPSLPQTVTMMLRNPERVFNSSKDAEAYKHLLIAIEMHWSQLEHHPSLITSMQRAPFLLGVKYVNGEKEGDTKGEVSLYCAADIAIIDDVITFNQFRNYIVAAPQDDVIERLYSRLGVKNVSQALKEEIMIGARIDSEAERRHLEVRVNERLRLFLDNTAKRIKPGAHQVQVSLVGSLKLMRELPPYASIIVSKAAFMNPDVSNNLLIVPGEKFEWIDVAVALSKAFLFKPDQDSYVVLETQLSSDLTSLERKGYNVERLRRKGLQQFDRKAPRLEFSNENPDDIGVTQGDLKKRAGSLDGPKAPPTVGVEPSQSAESSPNAVPGPALNNKRGKSVSQQPRPNDAQPRHPVLSQMRSLFRQGLGVLHQQEQVSQPSTTRDVQQQLQSALKKGLAYDGSNLNAPRHVDTPTPFPERACTNNKKFFELERFQTLSNGMRVFTTAEAPNPRQNENELSQTLLFLCTVFGYSPNAVHLYRDSDVSVVAFNQNGSLFFNSCVDPGMPSLPDYYYPVMAHELAHNLASSHGATHSFYTEAYIQNSIEAFAALRGRS